MTASDAAQASPNGTVYLDKLAQLFSRVIADGVTGRALASGAARGLTWAQFDGLRYLGRHSDSSVGDIAGGLGISYPAASRLVKRLEKRGLARRRAADDDKRVVQVALTELGAQLERGTRARRLGLLDRLFDNLSDSRRRALVTDLERFLAAALADRRLCASVCLRCGTDHDPGCVVNRAHIALTGDPISAF